MKSLLEDQEQAADEVVSLLTSILGSAQPGSLNAKNATHVLLEAIELSPALDSSRAEDAADEIIRQQGRQDLEDRDFAATIGLSVRCGTKRGTALIKLVSASEDLLYTPPARVRLIQEYSHLGNEGRSLAAEAVIPSIRNEQTDALDAIAALDADIQSDLMGRVGPALRGIFEKEVKRSEAKTAEQNEEEQQQQVDHKAAVTEGWEGPLESALDRLVQDAPSAATRLASAILTLNRPVLSDAVGSRLSSLAPIQDTELRHLALVKASGRPLSGRTAWLLPLGPSDLGGSSASRLIAVAAKTWVDVIDEGGDRGEILENLIREIKRLAAAATDIDTNKVDAAIKQSLEQESIDDPASEQLEIAASLANELVDAGVANRVKTGTTLTHALSGALSVVPGGDPSGRPNLSSAFTVIRPHLEDADEDALASLFERARQAASDTVGLLRVETMVAVATAQRQRGLEFDSDATQEAVLGQIGVDPPATIAAASAWSDGGDLTARQLWAILEPHWPEGIPGALREAAMKRARDLSEREHQTLGSLAFDHVVANGAPPPANWEAIALRELPVAWVISELVSRSKAEDFDETSWRAILEICKQLTTGVAEAQRRIGEELLLPLAASGDAGFLLATDHLGLVGRGKTGQAIIEAFTEAADTDERKQLLSRQLGEDENLVKSLAKSLRKTIFGSSTVSSSDPNSDRKETGSTDLDASPESNSESGEVESNG